MLNSAQSNLGWDSKRQQLANHSLLPINHALLQTQIWDEAAILQRGEALVRSSTRHLEALTSSGLASMIESVAYHRAEMEINRQYVDSRGQSTVAFTFRRKAASEIRRNLLDIAIDTRIAGSGGRVHQTECIDALLREIVVGRGKLLVEMATLGAVPDAMHSMESYGQYLCGYDASAETPENERGAGVETALTLLFTVSSDLEPVWTFASPCAECQ